MLIRWYDDFHFHFHRNKRKMRCVYTIQWLLWNDWNVCFEQHFICNRWRMCDSRGKHFLTNAINGHHIQCHSNLFYAFHTFCILSIAMVIIDCIVFIYDLKSKVSNCTIHTKLNERKKNRKCQMRNEKNEKKNDVKEVTRAHEKFVWKFTVHHTFCHLAPFAW